MLHTDKEYSRVPFWNYHSQFNKFSNQVCDFDWIPEKQRSRSRQNNLIFFSSIAVFILLKIAHANYWFTSHSSKTRQNSDVNGFHTTWSILTLNNIDPCCTWYTFMYIKRGGFMCHLTSKSLDKLIFTVTGIVWPNLRQ